MTWLRFPLTLVLFLAAGTVAAAESPSIGDQASRCWTITSAMNDSNFTAKFDVRMDASGNVVDIAVVSYGPSTAAARQAVRSASQAVQQCSPYSIDDGAGLYVAKMRWSNGKPVLDKPAGLIDPFKPLSLPE